MKPVLKRKLKAIKAYIEKEERFQINNVIFHFKKLEKEQMKYKASMSKKIIKLEH